MARQMTGKGRTEMDGDRRHTAAAAKQPTVGQCPKEPDSDGTGRSGQRWPEAAEATGQQPNLMSNNRLDWTERRRTARTMLGLRCWDRDKDRTTKDRIGQMAKR